MGNGERPQSVLGEFQQWKEEIDKLPISLSKNGASVNSAEAQDALGGPSLSAGLFARKPATKAMI